MEFPVQRRGMRRAVPPARVLSGVDVTTISRSFVIGDQLGERGRSIDKNGPMSLSPEKKKWEDSGRLS